MKPKIILELEKELKTTFRKVGLQEISIWTKNRTEYTCDESGNIIGVKISEYKLNKIPKILLSCLHIQVLNLSHNHLYDISPLKDLKNLTILDLSFNQFSDIYASKDFKNLSEFYLNNNQLSDISALKNLNKLTRLFLNNI